jgi:predicted DNA-binding transcriptional regulator YafY
MPHDRSELDHPALVRRLSALLDALRAAPLKRHDLLARLGDVYPRTASARRMLDRDIEYLKTLGIVVERSPTRPPLYTLSGGTPIFDEDDLRALALIRETFGERHPQATAVQTLLQRLTGGLTEAEQRSYRRRQALRVPVQPAIDYTPYAALIERLEAAIDKRQMVRFRYRPGGAPRATTHRKVEPYEIEYYERHFYLVAYTDASQQVLDFRIDRIQDDDAFHILPDTWAGPRRHLLTFRYRLAAALAQGEISQRFAEQRVLERLPNGDVVIEAQGRSDFFIRRTLLKYAGNAEVLWPEWLRAQIAAEVAELARMYEVARDE